MMLARIGGGVAVCSGLTGMAVEWEPAKHPRGIGGEATGTDVCGGTAWRMRVGAVKKGRAGKDATVWLTVRAGCLSWTTIACSAFTRVAVE